MIILFLILLIILSFYTLTSPDLLYGVIALSAVSLVSALLFYLLHAPDVAITEAAVGAGVSTVIFVWAIRSTERFSQEDPSPGLGQKKKRAVRKPWGNFRWAVGNKEKDS